MHLTGNVWLHMCITCVKQQVMEDLVPPHIMQQLEDESVRGSPSSSIDRVSKTLCDVDEGSLVTRLAHKVINISRRRYIPTNYRT